MDKIPFAILGLGSRTTSFYLEELNKYYNQQKGGYSTCPLFLLNVDFAKINPLLPSPSSPLDSIMQNYIIAIEKLNTTHILLPNITLHETVDRLVVHKNLIHPIHLTVTKIKQNKWSTIVLFGSIYSMQSGYIRSIFNSNDIKIVLPSLEDQLFIDEVRKQVYHKTETVELIKNYHSLIVKYTENYPVVLACTELSIFKPAKHNLLDMAVIQMEAAIKLNL